LPPIQHDIPPYWPGLELETIRAFKMWYRAASNPKYFELTCPDEVDRIDGMSIPFAQFDFIFIWGLCVLIIDKKFHSMFFFKNKF